jgi:hypothetical protein
MKGPTKGRPQPAKKGHRYKIYQAETGATYQYFFEARRRVVRPEGMGPGSDFTFVVIADRGPPFALKVFVSDHALGAWRDTHGRELDVNEQYAVAKMRLFRAFDELERVAEERLNVVVDESNVEGLLGSLSLD